MKSIIAIAIFLLLSTISRAQMQIGATVGLQMPTGDFSTGLKTGYGLNAQGKYFLNENIALGLNLGYNRFETEEADLSCSMVPVTGLFEYHLGIGKFHPYVGADLGVYNYRWKVDLLGISESDSKLYFGFAPAGGIVCPINEMVSFCANLKYHYVTSEGSAATWLGINAGLVFKLK